MCGELHMSDMISGCRGSPSDDAAEAAFMQRRMILMQRNPVVTSFHVGEGLAQMVRETHNIGIGYNVQIRPHLLS